MTETHVLSTSRIKTVCQTLVLTHLPREAELFECVWEGNQTLDPRATFNFEIPCNLTSKQRFYPKVKVDYQKESGLSKTDWGEIHSIVE